jgi:hypothetical protein
MYFCMEVFSYSSPGPAYQKLRISEYDSLLANIGLLNNSGIDKVSKRVSFRPDDDFENVRLDENLHGSSSNKYNYSSFRNPKSNSKHGNDNRDSQTPAHQNNYQTHKGDNFLNPVYGATGGPSNGGPSSPIKSSEAGTSKQGSVRNSDSRYVTVHDIRLPAGHGKVKFPEGEKVRFYHVVSRKTASA